MTGVISFTRPSSTAGLLLRTCPLSFLTHRQYFYSKSYTVPTHVDSTSTPLPDPSVSGPPYCERTHRPRILPRSSSSSPPLRRTFRSPLKRGGPYSRGPLVLVPTGLVPTQGVADRDSSVRRLRVVPNTDYAVAKREEMSTPLTADPKGLHRRLTTSKSSLVHKTCSHRDFREGGRGAGVTEEGRARRPRGQPGSTTRKDSDCSFGVSREADGEAQ